MVDVYFRFVGRLAVDQPHDQDQRGKIGRPHHQEAVPIWDRQANQYDEG